MILIFVFLIVVSSSHGLTIECTFRNETWVVVGTLYTCHFNIVDSINPTEVTDVYGVHHSGKSSLDVEGLHVQPETILSRFPQKIEEIFPNLSIISWVDGVLTSITADDLKPFPKLRFLDLYNNNIESLDGDLFQYTSEIQHVNFGHNLIKTVGDGLFDGLELKNAGFYLNPCISVIAETPAAIQEFKSLLKKQCGPSSTISTSNESGKCSVRCSMNEETDQLKTEVSELRQRVEELERRQKA